MEMLKEIVPRSDRFDLCPIYQFGYHNVECVKGFVHSLDRDVVPLNIQPLHRRTFHALRMWFFVQDYRSDRGRQLKGESIIRIVFDLSASRQRVPDFPPFVFYHCPQISPEQHIGQRSSKSHSIREQSKPR